MSDDLIRREDALNALKGVIARTGLHGVAIEIILANLDSVEAEPVVHAHWEPVIDEDAEWDELAYYRCSACGMVEFNERKRCPECGAHMDEEVV